MIEKIEKFNIENANINLLKNSLLSIELKEKYLSNSSILLGKA